MTDRLPVRKGVLELLILPSCQRKRPGGDTARSWTVEESGAHLLSKRSSTILLECRRNIAERFGYPEGQDLGGPVPRQVPLMPAFNRYDGNLYRRIDKSMWESVKHCNSVDILIVSALYGLVTPWENIRDYDCPITIKMDNTTGLLSWWCRRGLGELITEYIRKSGPSVVHDFLGGGYAALDKIFTGNCGASTRIEHYKFAGAGSATNHYRGHKIQRLLAGHLASRES